MTPTRFRQIRNLFEAALERDPATRSVFLCEACWDDAPLRLEVERLLDAYHGEAPLLDAAVAGSGRMEGRRIGPYEILRELGRGGMGAVYLAVRTDDVYRKSVAFKVVRPEVGFHEVIERFRQEREILAALDHPNIARLLDGGTTPEGMPYFVMDYVDGQPIDQYCDQRQVNIAERMSLFRSVCAAVEYAHRRGVVHRDLKPGNILVTADGVVKLLDFGIAKLLRTGAEENTAYVTRTGLRVMTPEYASPEQVRGEEVGAASDIYSLAVVLYELLTGHRPYRMSSRVIHEVVRIICEEEPVKPSTAVTTTGEKLTNEGAEPIAVTPESVSRVRAATPGGLQRQLSGDPDKILLKALDKDPARRYRTVEEFSEDLRRHLEGVPVLARGQGLLYRAQKFVLRYRAWMLGAVALAVGGATGAIKLSPWAMFLAMAFLGLFFLGYWQRREQIGNELASQEMFPLAMYLAIVLSVGIAAFQLIPRRRPSEWAGDSSIIFLIVLVATRFVQWRFREFEAGGLLLEVTSPARSRWSLWLPMLWAASVLISFRFMPVPNYVWNLFNVVLALLIGSGGVATEIRERGIVFHSLLLRWSYIEAYTWEPGRRGKAILKLRVNRSGWTLFPPGPWKRIAVPVEQKSAVSAMLSGQFSSTEDPPSTLFCLRCGTEMAAGKSKCSKCGWSYELHYNRENPP